MRILTITLLFLLSICALIFIGSAVGPSGMSGPYSVGVGYGLGALTVVFALLITKYDE